MDGDFVTCVCGLELVQMLMLLGEPVEKLAYSYWAVLDAHVVESSGKGF